jgi:hypothetical protein
MLVNQETAPREILGECGREESCPVEADLATCACAVAPIIRKDFAIAGSFWRHDPIALAEATIGLAQQFHGE